MKVFLAALAAAMLLPASALAVESEGVGANVRHVKNIPHTNPEAATRADGAENEGTDIEFATITVAPAGGVPPKARKPKAKRCARPSKRLAGKTAKRAKRKFRACKRRARARARARTADADPKQPGVQRDFAFVGSYFDGIDIVDVTNRANPEVVANYDCAIAQGDVQVFERDGRHYVAYADDAYEVYDSRCTRDLPGRPFESGSTPDDGGGLYIVDVTNPYEPQSVSFVPVELGSHNLTVHPSGNYIYNSNSELITSFEPAVEIIDISNLRAPEQVGAFDLETYPGLGTEAHDISFNKEGTRAYVAALSHGEILDTTDPANPVHVSTVLDPAINVWHQTEEVTVGERSYLIAEDEFAGASETAQCPNGAVHVYDITDEASPAKVGAFQIDEVGPTENGLGRCTAHVFQIHEEEQLLIFGWYNAGVRVLDLSELEGYSIGEVGTGGIKQLGFFRFPDSDVWAAKAPTVNREGFHFYANDHARGLDVFEYEPETAMPAGRWLTPEQALAGAQRLRARGDVGFKGLCMVR